MDHRPHLSQADRDALDDHDVIADELADDSDQAQHCEETTPT